MDVTQLRADFVRLLTLDSETQDRRRREYNQSIFAPAKGGGYAIFSRTDLAMVLHKFDRAARMAGSPPEPAQDSDIACERLTGGVCDACLCNESVPGYRSGCQPRATP